MTRVPLDHHPEEPETGPPGIRCSCGADWGPLGCEALEDQTLWGDDGPAVGQVITIAGTSTQTRWTGTRWVLAEPRAEGLDPCPHCVMEHVWPCPTIPRCDEPGCANEASCGWPTRPGGTGPNGGYRRTCGVHYRAAMVSPLSDDGGHDER